MKKLTFLLALFFALTFAFTGCREDKSAGDRIDEGIENVEEGAEEIGDEIEEGAEDLEDEIDDNPSN